MSISWVLLYLDRSVRCWLYTVGPCPSARKPIPRHMPRSTQRGEPNIEKHKSCHSTNLPHEVTFSRKSSSSGLTDSASVRTEDKRSATGEARRLVVDPQSILSVLCTAITQVCARPAHAHSAHTQRQLTFEPMTAIGNWLLAMIAARIHFCQQVPRKYFSFSATPP
jgi:hypothetical protein